MYHYLILYKVLHNLIVNDRSLLQRRFFVHFLAHNLSNIQQKVGTL